MWEDVTTVLELQSYWASYNSPSVCHLFNADAVDNNIMSIPVVYMILVISRKFLMRVEHLLW